MRTKTMVRAWVLIGFVGCASANGRYDEGRRAFSAGSWRAAIEAFEDFLGRTNCGTSPTDARCTEVRVAIAECHLRLGDPKEAYFSLEGVRVGAQRSAPTDAAIERVEREAQETFAARVQRPAGQGSLSVRFKSEPRKHLYLKFVRFFLDLHPLPTDNVPYVEGTTVLSVPPTPASLGNHELEVFAVFEGRGPYYGGYRFSAHSDYTFDLGPNQPVEVEVRLVDAPAAHLADSIKIDFVPR